MKLLSHSLKAKKCDSLCFMSHHCIRTEYLFSHTFHLPDLLNSKCFRLSPPSPTPQSVSFFPHVPNGFLSFLPPFIFVFPLQTCRSLLLHAVCSGVHWAAQIRAWCVDVGSWRESGSVSGCRGPADLSPGKLKLPGAHGWLLTTTTSLLCGIHVTKRKDHC